ncbi:ATP-binding protein [Sphingomonas sp. DT-204]|uniref:PAS domain-containing sensor histidine kinase n=1 Tax=Sphingomonas sp. DT-204 TaxID=3396166 RepID=UPI003F1BEF67
MNAFDTALVPVIGRVDTEGRLTNAEPRLIDLVRRAGGDLGMPLPIPELAALGRLAVRLGIPIAREVTVADGSDDLDLLIRAEPDAEGVTLAMSGWYARPAWRAPAPAVLPVADPILSEGDWRWDADAALRITYLQPDAGERYGVNAAAALGEPLNSLFALEEDGQGAFPILSAVAAQMRFDGQQAELRGTGRRVRLSAVPRIDQQGRFAGFVGVAHMLGETGDDAVSAAGPFPGGFGAELGRALRAPLERIIANADSMSAEIEGPLAASYTDYAGDIAAAGRHLLGLVDDLVDLEAVEREDFAIQPEPIDLADIARRAAGLLAVRAGEQRVHIDRPGADETLPATGDFRRALQIMVNLIGNAVRYSPADGTIWIRSGLQGSAACVIVADQGKGIAPEDQARIFDKFERVDGSEPGGSGLGLYISRRLARAMGGDILVDSAPGQGARFVFSLPARG